MAPAASAAAPATAPATLNGTLMISIATAVAMPAALPKHPFNVKHNTIKAIFCFIFSFLNLPPNLAMVCYQPLDFVLN
jgi:hypothetical protein